MVLLAAALPGLTPSERAILAVLAKHANHDGSQAFPGVPVMAAFAGLGHRAVQYTLRKLEGRGLIAVEAPAVRYRPTTWRLTFVPASAGVQSVHPSQPSGAQPGVQSLRGHIRNDSYDSSKEPVPRDAWVRRRIAENRALGFVGCQHDPMCRSIPACRDRTLAEARAAREREEAAS